MTFSDYVRMLAKNGGLDEYALACGSTAGYITTHLLPARKIPKRDLLIALSENSGGHVTEFDVLRHFGLLKSHGEKIVSSMMAS